MTIKICSNCDVGVSGDDWTHLDYWCECAPGDAHSEDCAAEKTHASVLSSMEHWGWLTRVGPGEPSSVFSCALCDDNEYGVGVVYSTQREAT